MEASILIVSHDRKTELQKTLQILEDIINKDKHEVRVFLDGSTDGSQELEEDFPWVYWYSSEKTIGASGARNILYSKAKGETLFGFDDDAHPLQKDFIARTKNLFRSNENLGIIGFQEIKGIYETIPEELFVIKVEYLTNEFLGCGFAIKKEVYEKTRGFPVWIDIYGEEVCVAWETMIQGYDILFTSKIRVHHRVNKQTRRELGANYLRFEKQLKNTTFFYFVYYPFPWLIIKIIKLHLHNFTKYALKDRIFLKQYFKAGWNILKGLPEVWQFRRPLSKNTIDHIKKMKTPLY